jgi:hypothetical protein
MTLDAYTVLIITAAIVVLLGLIVLWRDDKRSLEDIEALRLGRELLEAAGSKADAKLAIEGALLDRLRRQKQPPPIRPPATVYRIGRLAERGNPIHETHDGAA